MARSITPKAMPSAKSPLPVSRVIAVVMVLVCHLIFPPNIIAEPTSPIILPYEVRAAAKSRKRPSHRLVSASFVPEAPKVLSVRASLLSSPSMADAV